MKLQRRFLKDIATFSNGINFDKSAYGEGVKIINVSDFGELFSPNYELLSEVKKEYVRKNDYLYNGDIVFVRSNGNKELIGRCMLIIELKEPITYSGFCIRCRITELNLYNPVYLTYYFKSESFRRVLTGNAVGANIQNLSQSRLSNVILAIPSIEKQNRIADILSAYDNLIENNQKQIKLLEEAAQRLYKEWFVDLRFPGHETTPIVDGVPEGWKIRKVSDFGEVITGKTPSTSHSEFFGGDIPFVKIPDMHNCVFSVSTEGMLTELGANSQKKKYIPKDSIMVSCIATVGLVNISVQTCQTNQQINSIVLAKHQDLYYLYFCMKGIRSLLDGVGSNGATMTNVNKSKFENLNVIYPTDKLIEKFFTICKPFFTDIFKLSIMNQKLKEARDRLLPKLMSGEIEV